MNININRKYLVPSCVVLKSQELMHVIDNAHIQAKRLLDVTHTELQKAISEKELILEIMHQESNQIKIDYFKYVKFLTYKISPKHKNYDTLPILCNLSENSNDTQGIKYQ